MFWWFLSFFAYKIGWYYDSLGTLLNSIVMAIVLGMTEKKMIDNWDASRVKMYKLYMAYTSAQFLLPPKANIILEDKS
jgi:hypothetical protein